MKALPAGTDEKNLDYSGRFRAGFGPGAKASLYLYGEWFLHIPEIILKMFLNCDKIHDNINGFFCN